MKRITMAALVALTTTPMAQAQEHSPEAVAASILTGFQQRDVTMIAGHSNETNAVFFTALAAGTEDLNDLWGADRGGAGALWDGMILPVRYRNRSTALVPFAIEGPDGPAALGSGVAGRYMSVVLTLDSADDSTWGFEDINYTDRDAFEGYLLTR